MQTNVLPAGTLTFLFTDIEGSTRLLRALGEAYADVLATHHDLIREAVVAYDGFEVGTEGDAFFVVFERPADALGAALAAQRSLLSHRWPVADVRVRMGVHTGDAVLAATGYVGMAIHQAARIAAAAHGAQVLVSDATRSLVGGDLPPGAGLADLGLHRLKDFDEPQHIHQLCHRELPADLAPLRTPGAHNLPTPPTPFLGRAAELEALGQLVCADGSRLVTVSGAAGIGKTRLVIEAAKASANRFKDGARFVALAAVENPDDVPWAIAQAVGLPELQGQPLDLPERLRDFELLLVLDNFEHLLEAAPLVARVLSTCPGLKALVASRALLGLRGEHAFPVSLLATPDPDESSVEALCAMEAVVFFAVRAREAHPQFALTDANAGTIAEICRRLDGLPLALELAAPRLRLFSPEALLGRLEDRFALVAGGGSDHPSRHQTLEAAIAWSYDLLDEEEKALLSELAVFAGGFGLEAAEAVTSASGRSFLSLFASLLDKSLVSTMASAPGDVRFSMLETIRAFALVRLNATGTAPLIRDRHAAYFLDRAQGAAPALASAARESALRQLDAENNDLRAAIEWSIDAGKAQAGLGLASSLGWFWYHRGAFEEGRRLLDGVLAMPDRSAPPLEAQALTAAARLAYYQADHDAAVLLADEAIAIARHGGLVADLGFALYVRALAAQGLGDPAAVGFAQEAVAELRRTTDRWALAVGLFYLGVVAVFVGPEDVVLPALAESEALFRELGDSWGVGGALFYRGMIRLRHGDLATAEPLIEESVAMFRPSGDRWRLMTALAFLADVTNELGGDPTPLRAESETLRRQLGLAPT